MLYSILALQNGDNNSSFDANNFDSTIQVFEQSIQESKDRHWPISCYCWFHGDELLLPHANYTHGVCLFNYLVTK